ncbi:CMP-N-acetylneuraminate-beta-galactosamide-alpha-2,3-sialyltransferase 4-like isoform X3 [Brienomyrus brachyistius]|uniref:CMP-N-acetylneuraminate-beta-galactosamide- alpha-2,3-sialyltransferase 4-like isoform X3 n=1 Tax=Brienomyrus brachyistius TaxID=42636 RepID=UPI0020B401A3|nr:CMP-N-acetylneuraminate-beta-galactosamide-alpha-2,3-sialyltransferase 4-like isoform X3 [Brienomyrus brachyistius]
MPSLEKETSVSPEKICCKNTKIWLIRLMLLGITLVSYQFFSILQSLEDSSTSPSIYGTACNSFRLWDSLRLNSKCRTCVVIGNGFIIKNTSLGNTINQYDVVIRINDGPVRGFEKDVGNKTTMRFFYPESAVSDPNVHNEPDTLMVLVPFKLVDLIWLRDILYNKKRIVQLGFWKPPPRTWLGRSSQFRILDPFFMHHTASDLLGTPFNPDKPVCPTSGMLAVYVALNFCSVVHLAGFGYPSDKNDLIHYFGRDTMDFMINSEHNVTHEAQVLKRLEDHGVIQFLHPH